MCARVSVCMRERICLCMSVYVRMRERERVVEGRGLQQRTSTRQVVSLEQSGNAPRHQLSHQVDFGCRPSRFGEIKTVLLVGPTEVCVCVCERERERATFGEMERVRFVGPTKCVCVCVCCV